MSRAVIKTPTALGLMLEMTEDDLKRARAALAAAETAGAPEWKLRTARFAVNDAERRLLKLQASAEASEREKPVKKGTCHHCGNGLAPCRRCAGRRCVEHGCENCGYPGPLPPIFNGLVERALSDEERAAKRVAETEEILDSVLGADDPRAALGSLLGGLGDFLVAELAKRVRAGGKESAR